MARRLHLPFDDGAFRNGNGLARDRSRNARTVQDLYAPGCRDITVGGAGEGDGAGVGGRVPAAALGESNGSVDVAVAFDPARYVDIARAGNMARDGAPFANERRVSAGSICKSSVASISHAQRAPGGHE